MPLDPNIILQARGPQIDSVADVARSAMTLGQMAKQGQLVDKQIAQLGQKDQQQEYQNAINKLELSARLLGGSRDQNSYTQNLGIAKSYGLDVSQLPQQYDPNFVQSMLGRTLSAKDQIEQMNKTRDFGLKEREVAVKEKEAGIKGQLADAKAKGASGPKKIPVQQAKQQGLYQQGLLAEQQFRDATSKDKSWWKRHDPTSSFNMIDNAGDKWYDFIVPNEVKSTESQQARGAMERWVEAFLRDASGAAIPPSERMAYAKDFFPQPGDSDEVVTQKAQARKVKMDTAKFAAGESVDFGDQLHTASDDDIEKMYKELGGT